MRPGGFITGRQYPLGHSGRWSVSDVSQHGYDGAIAPDGIMIMAGANARDMHLWSWPGPRVNRMRHGSPIAPIAANSIDLSPDMKLLACALAATPFVAIMSFPDGRRLADPSTLPTGQGRGVAFSPDGTKLAVVHATSPFLTVYNTSDWSKIANPANLPPDLAVTVAFSPDGTKLAVGHATSPFLTVYNTSDWSKIANPANLPGSFVLACKFSPDGSKLAVITGNVEPYVSIYDTTTWARTVPAQIIGAGTSCSWSPDGTLLAVGSMASPYIATYTTSDWSMRATPSPLPPAVSYPVFSPDGLFIFCYAQVSPYQHLFRASDMSSVALDAAAMSHGSAIWRAFPRDMPPPPDPPASPAYYLVSSASGTIGIEGKYYENGTANGRPKYEQENDGPGMLLYAMDMMSEGLVWQVFDANNGFAYENWNIQPATPYIGTYYSQMDAAEITVSYVPAT